MSDQSPMQPYFAPMGELSMRFSRLEAEVHFLIACLMNVNIIRTEIVLGHILNFGQHIDIFSQLAHHRCPDAVHRRTARNLRASLTQVNDGRNDLLHGNWRNYNEPALIQRFRRGEIEADWRDVETEPARIAQLSRRVFGVTERVRRFAAEVQELNKAEAKAAT
jgi:hypothetical protein